jgi:hypothetical protein
MKSTHPTWFLSVILAPLAVGLSGSLASVPTAATASFDKRRSGQPGDAPQMTAERKEATDRLRDRLPSVRIDYDLITAAPKSISSTLGFLSGPPELETRRVGGLGVAPDDPHRAIKAFLAENAVLFGHGIEVLTNSTISREFVTPHNGMRTVVWQQQLDGIPVLGALLMGHMTRRGELVSISSGLLPDVESATGMASTNRLRLALAPPISARQALANALTDLGERIPVEEVRSSGGAARFWSGCP